MSHLTTTSFRLVLTLATSLSIGALSTQAQEEKPKTEAPPKRYWPEDPHNIKGREEAVFAEILALPNGHAKLLALNELAARWVESDRAAAWAQSAKIKDGMMRPAFLRGLMPKMVREAPEEVLTRLEEGVWWPDQWIHVKDATVKVAKTDLDRAIDAFENATPERSQNEWVVQNLAIELVRQRSPEAAIEFADRQSRAKFKNVAYRGLSEALVKLDERRALEIVEGLEEDTDARRDAIFGLVIGKGWNDDPNAAIQWAAGLAIDEMRRRALLEMAWQWSQSDKLAWVISLKENPNVRFDDWAFVEERLKASGVFLE